MPHTTDIGLPRQMIRSLAGLSLLTLMTVACPSVGMAQLPALAQNTNRAESEVSYTLGAGDRISIDILKLPDYSGEYEVLVDGTLNLPLIGSVYVEGKSLAEASQTISNQYAQFLRRPIVTLSLLEPRPLRVGIAGEVNRPGSYTIERVGSQFPTLTQVLKTAGGITQAADLRMVQVRRPQSSGQEQVINVDLWQFLQTGELRYDLKLRDGDTVFVPTATNINLAEASQLALSSFSADQASPLKVVVVGEVYTPGTHTVAGENSPGGLPTLTEAIKVAGGVNPSANIRQVQIRRPTKAGFEQTIEVDLWKLLQAGDSRQDVILQSGDTVVVPTATNINLAEATQLTAASFFASEIPPLNVTVVGEVYRPGPYTVTGTAETREAGETGGTGGAGRLPTVSRAIQLAGGIKPLADIRQIQIRRPTSTGSQQFIEVDLWKLLQAGDSSQDALLQEGDTIIIPTATDLDPAEATQVAAASFSPDTIRVNVVGEVDNPGVVQVQPNTPLNQALLAAGGFNNRARKGSVVLVRLNPNGTVSKRKVDVNLAEGVNEETNPVLGNNDVVIVGRSGLASVSDTLDTALGPLGKFLTILSFPARIFGIFD